MSFCNICDINFILIDIRGNSKASLTNLIRSLFFILANFYGKNLTDILLHFLTFLRRPGKNSVFYLDSIFRKIKKNENAPKKRKILLTFFIKNAF